MTVVLDEEATVSGRPRSRVASRMKAARSRGAVWRSPPMRRHRLVSRARQVSLAVVVIGGMVMAARILPSLTGLAPPGGQPAQSAATKRPPQTIHTATRLTPHRASTPAGAPSPQVTSSAAAPADPAAPGPWTLTFADTFSGSGLDHSKWSTCYDWECTNAGNNELEWYEARNVTVSGGTAKLTARPGRTHGKTYTSGMIQSSHKYTFRYGYAEIRAKLPMGTGLWSAFWLLPQDHSWPPEIDIMENWGSSTNVGLYVHYLHKGKEATGGRGLTGLHLSSGFHTFAVDWEPHRITWYVDGKAQATASVSLSKPMYLLANLAINGWHPPTSLTHFPASLTIDWIRVWQRPATQNTQNGGGNPG